MALQPRFAKSREHHSKQGKTIKTRINILVIFSSQNCTELYTLKRWLKNNQSIYFALQFIFVKTFYNLSFLCQLCKSNNKSAQSAFGKKKLQRWADNDRGNRISCLSLSLSRLLYHALSLSFFLSLSLALSLTLCVYKMSYPLIQCTLHYSLSSEAFFWL
jgi:hypothetical protein